MSFLGRNAAETSISDIWLPLALTLAVSAIAWLLSWLLFRDAVRSALFATLVVVLFFSAGVFRGAMGDFSLRPLGIGIGPTAVLYAASVVVIAVAYVWLRRAEAPPIGVFRIVRAMGVAFLVSALAFAGYTALGSSRSATASEGVSDKEFPAEAAGIDEDRLPDIYYLVFDGYGREDVLKEAGGFSNREFTEGLEEQGFFVADAGNSNYAVTQLSLASSLNMEYLEEFVTTDDGLYARAQFREPIESPRVVEELRDAGYSYVHVDSGWGYTSDPETADVHLRPSPGRYTILEFLRTTWLEPWVDGLTAADKRAHVLETFELLEGAEEDADGPLFVFAHVLVPHRPYVFGRDGESVSSDRWSTMAGREDYVGFDAYTDQLLYTNTLIEELLDSLMEERDRPLVVVLQGDHGIRSRRPDDPDLPDERIVSERHAILSAYYFSEGTPEDLYPSISPVNTFRVVLNEAVGADYVLLEDRAYYSSHLLDNKEPWGKLEEVTDVVAGTE